MGAVSFTATLRKRGPAAAVVLGEEQVAEVGEGAKRFPVRATVAGHSWRESIDAGIEGALCDEAAKAALRRTGTAYDWGSTDP
jgi:hypothetical protein